MNSDEEVQGLGERIKVLVHRGHKKVVLNLAEVTMTSSMGISLMIRASTFWKQAAAVVLANVQPYVLHQLEGIGLVGHMKLFPTLDQALAYLDGPRGHADG
jgi:anti-anti-sigma regulatory factor